MGFVCAPASTYVEMCYTEEFLRLKYLAAGDPFLKNTYTTCDSETYNQEVVEVFIAPNANDSLVYHEVRRLPDCLPALIQACTV